MSTAEWINLGGMPSVYTECITCGVRYAFPETLWDQQQKAGGYHHCPNGHAQGWSKDQSTEGQLRRERDRLKQQVAQRDDEIETERRRTAAQRGENTKLKKRAAKGVCLCCHRSFVNLRRHMASKHPNFDKLEVIEGGKKSA